MGRFSLIVRAGIATGICDGLFATFLSTLLYGSTFTGLWQGVAATVLGKQAFDGGRWTALIGLYMHFGVALGWSAVLFVLVMLWPWVRRTLLSQRGVLKIAAVYGPAIWLVMSLIVIPLLLRRPPAITTRWWIQGIGHIPFVALPMAIVIRNGITHGEA